MEQLLLKIIEIIEEIGVLYTLLLSGILFLPMIGLLYLMIVLETYSGVGSLREIVSYGKYQVEIREKDSDTKEIKLVHAWNTANAVEKVYKKLDVANRNGLTFLAIKL